MAPYKINKILAEMKKNNPEMRPSLRLSKSGKTLYWDTLDKGTLKAPTTKTILEALSNPEQIINEYMTHNYEWAMWQAFGPLGLM